MLNVLRPAEVDAACQQQLGMSASAAIRGLQLLPDLQEWAMFGLLICPGKYKLILRCSLYLTKFLTCVAAAVLRHNVSSVYTTAALSICVVWRF